MPVYLLLIEVILLAALSLVGLLLLTGKRYQSKGTNKGRLEATEKNQGGCPVIISHFLQKWDTGIPPLSSLRIDCFDPFPHRES